MTTEVSKPKPLRNQQTNPACLPSPPQLEVWVQPPIEFEVDLDRLANEIFEALGCVLPTSEQYSTVCAAIISAFQQVTRYWRLEHFTEARVARATASAVNSIMAARASGSLTEIAAISKIARDIMETNDVIH